MNAAATTVVYAVDPLCGWCFAIGDALRAARRELAGEVRWEVALGGLVVGDRVRPIGEDADYLRRGTATVREVSGRETGAAYWRDLVDPGTWVSDSGPPVRAIVAVRDLVGDDAALETAHLLCDGMFLDGRAPDDPAQIRAVVAGLGLDADEVLARWGSDEGRAAAEAENQRARALGVTVYPSLFVRRGDSLVPVLTGYAPADAIVRDIREAATRFTAA